jgi:hypothetical protein
MRIIQSCHDSSTKCRIKNIRMKGNEKQMLKDMKRPTPRQMPRQCMFSETMRKCERADVA